MFKRSQHVGQCCFYCNTEGSLGLIFTKKSLKLQCCHVRPPLWRSMNINDGKRENTLLLLLFSAILKILPVTKKKKPRKLKQRRRERQRERYKTIDLITEYNHFMWECNHQAHRSPENKRNDGICWAKGLTDFKMDATYANIMQHSPTWCTNERNMFCPACWHNMLRSFARALTPSPPPSSRTTYPGVFSLEMRAVLRSSILNYHSTSEALSYW